MYCGGLHNPHPLQERASDVAPPPYVHPLLSDGTVDIALGSSLMLKINRF